MNEFAIPEIIISTPWEVEELIGNSINSTKSPCSESINQRLKQKLLKNKLAKSTNFKKTVADSEHIKTAKLYQNNYPQTTTRRLNKAMGTQEGTLENRMDETCSNSTSFGIRNTKHKIDNYNERSLDENDNNNNIETVNEKQPVPYTSSSKVTQDTLKRDYFSPSAKRIKQDSS